MKRKIGEMERAKVEGMKIVCLRGHSKRERERGGENGMKILCLRRNNNRDVYYFFSVSAYRKRSISQ